MSNINIKVLNNYSGITKPDKAEKIGKFLTYPIHVLVGKDFKQGLINGIQHSFAQKVMAAAVLILAAPLTLPAMLVGLIFKQLSPSHSKCRKTQAVAEQALAEQSLIAKRALTDPVLIKEKALNAAEGIQSGALHSPRKYSALNEMVISATVKMVPIIMEGAAEHQYSSGFESAFGFLVKDGVDKNNFEKLQAVLNSSKLQEKIENILDKELQWIEEGIASNGFKHKTNFASNETMNLRILLENKNRLMIPANMIEKAEKLMKLNVQVDEQTKDMPIFMYQ